MMADHEDFIARWSRRKLNARKERQAGETEAAEKIAEAPPAAPEPASPAPVTAAASQPPPPARQPDVPADPFADVDFEALDYQSDYTRFVADDVPELIQRKALRMLWRSDPLLANLDGLNDYDEDYTDAALASKLVTSAYRVGRGFASETDEEGAESAGGEPAPANEESDLTAVPEDGIAAPGEGATISKSGEAGSEQTSEATAPDVSIKTS